MLDRRSFLVVCSSFGLTSTLMPAVLWAMAEEKGKITREKIDQAASVIAVAIADNYKDMMLDNLNGYKQSYEPIYALEVPNSVALALIFDPAPAGMNVNEEKRPMRISPAPAGLTVPRTWRTLLFIPYGSWRNCCGRASG